MIYSNLIFFIIAIICWSICPETDDIAKFPTYINITAVFIINIWFWYLNRITFLRFKKKLETENKLDTSEARRLLSNKITLHLFLATLIFGGELFLLQVKFYFTKVPVLGVYSTFLNLSGITIFLFHFSTVWYNAFRAFGDFWGHSITARRYVFSNIKFNVPFVIPWLVYSLMIDFCKTIDNENLNRLLNTSSLQPWIFLLFIISISILIPIIIVRIWDCNPIDKPELVNLINRFCKSINVRFKQTMYWNALNGGLVTAGVIGLFYPFRYLLISPELVRLLDKDELLAVVCHEVAHVKKKHLLFYFLFILSFFILSFSSIEFFLNFLLNTSFGISLLISSSGEINKDFIKYSTSFATLFLFICYFRFIFGFFMRHFERQADIYCFQAGIDPQHMIAAFIKLKNHIGEPEKASNWHHFSISQRIAFLQACAEDKSLVKQYDKKLKRIVYGFTSILVILAVYLFFPYTNSEEKTNRKLVKQLEVFIKREPNNPKLYAYYGILNYELKNWKQAEQALSHAINLDPDQADALNNLAWLYLTCKDKSLHHPQRALTLAENAIKLKKSFYIFDTLAEAYYQNGKYEKALENSEIALKNATSQIPHLKRQLKKMQKKIRE